MKTARKVLLILCNLIFYSFAFTQTNVSGIINDDTTWTLNNSPYVVVGNLSVSNGVTLTIEAGVHIKFNLPYGITINGRMVANGSMDSLITFTSNDTTWQGGINFINSNNGCLINYCVIENCHRGVYNGIIQCDNSSPIISNCIIKNNKMGYGVISIYKDGSAIIANNLIKDNISTQVLEDGRDIGMIDLSWGYGAAWDNASAVIKNNVFDNNVGYGVGVFTGSNLTTYIKDNILVNNYGGIVSYAQTIECDYNDVWNNNTNYNGNISSGSHSISADPLFVNANNNDYHLQSMSPCIGTGEIGTDMGIYGFLNIMPVSNAGPDQITIDQGAQVILDGSNSFDPEHSMLFYQWTQVDGPTVSLSDSTSSHPSFIASALDVYSFKLIVNDGDRSSEPDSVSIVVSNQPPPPPLEISFSSSNGMVTLIWNKNTESDVIGYNIYRSQISSLNYNLLNPSPINDTIYQDITVTNAVTYYYALTSVDVNGRESIYSVEITASPPNNDIISVLTNQPPDVINAVYDSSEWINSYSAFIHYPSSNTDIRFRVTNNDSSFYFCIISNQSISFYNIYLDGNFNHNIDPTDSLPPYLDVVIEIGNGNVESQYTPTGWWTALTPTNPQVEYSFHQYGSSTIYEIAVPFNFLDGIVSSNVTDTIGFETYGPDNNAYWSGQNIYGNSFGNPIGNLTFILDPAVNIDEQPFNNYPTNFNLSQNYPNPFNPVTTFEYTIPKASNVELNIYNLLGQKVATLVSCKQYVGTYNVEWDASQFASGIYFYRLETENGFVQSRKLILLK